jgi:hypothetical protein
MSRGAKRLLIIIIYLILFSAIGLLLYLVIRPAQTCFDGKKNQKENEIDCGGPCPPCKEIPRVESLKVVERAFVIGSPGGEKYDLMAKIENPNSEYGSPKFNYQFELKNDSGNIIAQKEGSCFILPAETKYIVETNIETQSSPSSIEIKVMDNVVWDKFSGYGEHEEPQLNIYNKRYSLISSGAGYSEVYGLLRNESLFDFNAVNINIILRNAASEPVALNKTEMRTVGSREERDFRLVWPYSFPGDVQNIEMEAEADVFDSLNFIKRYLPDVKPIL